MVEISKMLNSTNPAYYEFSEKELARMTEPDHCYPGLFDRTIYESDEFRMYGFKIKRCPRLRSHDWTHCPFAHRGEKARRRDPRRYNYAAVACPDFRAGRDCRHGDSCHFAHGVFEYWLHPARYRTRTCNAGPLCNRRVCFFAHSLQELRDETPHHCLYRARSEAGKLVETAAPPSVAADDIWSGWGGGNADFLASLSGLTIKEGVAEGGGDEVAPAEKGVLGRLYAEVEVEVPDIEWIAEIVD